MTGFAILGEAKNLQDDAMTKTIMLDKGDYERYAN